MRHIVLAGALFLGSAARDGMAQQLVSPLEPDPVLAVRALRDSQMVRAVTSELGLSQGRVLQQNDSDLVLVTDGKVVRVSAASIDSLWVRRSHVKQGLLWGAGFGALVGLVLGFGVNQLCQGEGYSCPRAFPILILGGSAAGGGLGAAVGTMIPRWERQWP